LASETKSIYFNPGRLDASLLKETDKIANFPLRPKKLSLFEKNSIVEPIEKRFPVACDLQKLPENSHILSLVVVITCLILVVTSNLFFMNLFR